ncbi:MAG: acyl-ACP--UDP-N-acetylglucosamine O-acyltransferase [Dialister sp.]|nr:acyl-ACP--UDP-N-acetylglucosamine O-acyltransferase [Dialister sp.]
MELKIIKNAAPEIHDTAVIDPSAIIHKNTIIGPYAVIGPNCEIGEGTVIGAHAVIAKNVRMGRNNHIYPHCVIGEDPQDLKYTGEYSTVVIGDENLIREFCTVHRATGENCETRIGSHNMFQTYTHIAHNCDVGDYVVMSGYSGLAGHVVVEDHSVIGAKSGVHQFVKIGACAMVGGMSKIVQDVCPFTIVDGNPARVVGLNSVGLSRNQITPEVKSHLKKAYRLIFRSGLKLSEAIHEMEQELPSTPEIEHLLRFLRNCERGLCRTRER